MFKRSLEDNHGSVSYTHLVVTGTTAGNAVIKVTPKEGFSDPNELSAEVEVTVE